MQSHSLGQSQDLIGALSLLLPVLVGLSLFRDTIPLNKIRAQQGQNYSILQTGHRQNRAEIPYFGLFKICLVMPDTYRGDSFGEAIREDRDGTPNGTKVVQFLTLFGVPPDGWKREAFAPNP